MAGVACTSVLMADTACSPWVAVFGLGMVGNFAAQAFRILGCRVIGIDPNSERRTLAGQCGLTTVIAGGDDVVTNLRTLTGGRGPSIVVDATGLSQVITQAIGACADSGEVILLGTPRSPCPGDITPPLADIHYRNLTLRGALEWNLPHQPTPGLRHSLYSKQAMIFDWMERGELQVKPLVSHVLPPTQIRNGYEGLLNEPGTYTGVVLDWRQT
jgi:threonine dehydrogenase-like Zn-dependent dehydrogenase